MNIDITDEQREPITLEEMRKLMAWSFGERGRWIADRWHRFNCEYFSGVLVPTPIWFPASPPYGHWWGLFTGAPDRQTFHIQIKRGMGDGDTSDILIHEMVHQRLYEGGKQSNHNTSDWCEEIMRLTRLIWQKEIWAAPDSPRRINGKSKRVQAKSSEGLESIPRIAIAGWPHSLGLTTLNCK